MEQAVSIGLGQQGQTWELSHYIPHPGTPATLFMPTARQGTHSLKSQAPLGPHPRAILFCASELWVCCKFSIMYTTSFWIHLVEFLLENSAQLSHSSERT